MYKRSSATIYSCAFILTLANHVFGRHFSEGWGIQAAGAGRRSYDIPITTIGASKIGHDYKGESSATAAIAGISGGADILYTIPINVGDKILSLNLDTGSSDLWIASDVCHENACANSTVARYSKSQSSSTTTDLHIDMKYGDSHSGTYASGTIGLDIVSLHGGPSLTHQPLGLISETTNLLVQHNASGIIGLGFPAGSHIQETMEMNKSGIINGTDGFILSTPRNGPFVPRLAMHGLLKEPMFDILGQRHDPDWRARYSEPGKTPRWRRRRVLNVGSRATVLGRGWWHATAIIRAQSGMLIPDYGKSKTTSLTRLPMAIELYPFRWEIEIDGVFLDGKRLPDSVIPPRGVKQRKSSALIDTGNSLLRGPEDVVADILHKASPIHSQGESSPVVPCDVPRTLAFGIGGKMFPVDPRDFISQLNYTDAHNCHLDNLVPADAPSPGSLFQWNLGTPFFRSNFVIFHYGNLTHPSVDPPRIGFRSKVPVDAGQILINAVEDARRCNHLDDGSHRQVPFN